jgi:hypothetical protein
LPPDATLNSQIKKVAAIPFIVLLISSFLFYKKYQKNEFYESILSSKMDVNPELTPYLQKHKK